MDQAIEGREGRCKEATVKVEWNSEDFCSFLLFPFFISFFIFVFVPLFSWFVHFIWIVAFVLLFCCFVVLLLSLFN